MKYVVGLVGKVCAGKSTVAALFAKRGAAVYDADKAVHALYSLDDVKEKVFEAFGPGVFSDTKVNRKALADIVFVDPAAMKTLTAVIHPRIAKQIGELILAFKNKKDTSEILLLDAPTLFQSGLDKLCDKIVFVTANDVRRQDWAAKNRGWAATDLVRRDALLGFAFSRTVATVTNNDGLDELEARVDEILAWWKSTSQDPVAETAA